MASEMQLQPKRFRFQRTNQIFVFHQLTNVDRETLVHEWKQLDERRRRRQLPLFRKLFLKYHIEVANLKKMVFEMKQSSKVADMGEAKQWFWLIEKYPLVFKSFEWRANELRLRSSDRGLAMEVIEWFYCAERHGYLNYINDLYFKDEFLKIERLKKIEVKKIRRPSKNDLAKADSLLCTQIRLYFENRKGLIFNLDDVRNIKDVTPKDVKNLLTKQINEFTKEVNKKFIAHTPKKETRKKMFEITLLQETTKAAFSSIQAFQSLLQTGKQLVTVDCAVIDNRLSFNIGHIKEQFKAPISALSRIEWTRFAPDDIEDMAEKAALTITSHLDPMRLAAHPAMADFGHVIADEKIPEDFSESELLSMHKATKTLQLRLRKAPREIGSFLFKVTLSNVWLVIQQRLRQKLQALTLRIRREFTQELHLLQEEFRRYDRALLFRSINPSLMLSNKAIVNSILENDVIPSVQKLVALYDRIFNITQFIALEPTQQDLLVALAGYRIALPGQIKDHRHFFQKRIASFQTFVNKKQTSVLSNVQQVADRLKILQTMANPQESDQYLTEVISLIPPLTELITEIDDLNKFEEVVGIVKTEIPRMRQVANDVKVMEDLFKETTEYYKHMNDFFESRRTVVNVSKSKQLLDAYLMRLALLESQLGGQRAARHFIINARNDLDVFKKNFAVAEVMSCKRFLDQHWTKMSEIAGFDLSTHANSSMAILCELGLDDILSQLKPIAFAAEREALVSDQLDGAIAHWTKAHIETHSTNYWSLEIPGNLRELRNQAERHISLLTASRDVENAYSQLNHDINKWTLTITKLREIFAKWHALLEDWLRVAKIFESARDTLQLEFSLFRRCAKYWLRFEKFIRQDSAALRILELRHAPCWLNHIDEHMRVVVKGVQTHLNVIRLSIPRLCLASDHDLLQLFASTSIRQILPILIREGFPQLKRLDFNRRGQLEVIDLLGDRLVLDTVTIDSTEGSEIHDLISMIEAAFVEKVQELLLSDNLRSVPKMVTSLASSIDNRNVTEMLSINKIENQYYIQHKTIQAQAQLTLDFIQIEDSRRLSQSLCATWARGQFPLLIGEMTNTRSTIETVARKLFSSVRYVNCHRRLQTTVFENLIQIAMKESILIALENVDQLDLQAFQQLNNWISKYFKAEPFPRLIMTSPARISSKSLSGAISIENVEYRSEKEAVVELVEEPVPYTIKPSTATSLREEKCQSVPPQQKTDIELLKDELKKKNISALAGPMAKSVLKVALGELAEEVYWLYVDMLTDDQLITLGSGFGSQFSGQLLKTLSDQKDDSSWFNESLSSYRSSLASTPVLKKFVVFYGNDRFWELLPFIRSLFQRFDDNQLPPPYLTLFDGSNFLPNDSIACIFCIPDDLSSGVRSELVKKFDIPVKPCLEDMKKSFDEIYKISWRSKFIDLLKKSPTQEIVETVMLKLISPLLKLIHQNDSASILLEIVYQEMIDLKGASTEVLASAVVIVACNFLNIYALGETIDRFVPKTWLNVFGDSFSLTLPGDVTSWKLSIEDPSTLVRWEDEPFHVSSMEKENRMEDLMVVWPAFDRMLHFGKRQLSLGHNLLVTGPPFTQKTTLVKMLQKQLPSSDFKWIHSHARVGLENAQKEFSKILKNCRNGEKQQYLVIDKFSFAEPLLPIIELFVDHKIYYSDGELNVSGSNLKFILICEEEDWITIRRTHVFYETFCHLPMKSVTSEEGKMIVERLLQWNLTTKSFSSEYHRLLEPVANATVKIATSSYVYFSPLPVCMRLVKALFFAFLDNAPDTLAFIRLWLHETLRVVGDSIDSEFEDQFMSDLKNLIKEEFGTSEKELFQNIESEHSESIESEHSEESLSDIKSLLFSELDNTESFDGLNYLPVKNMQHFNRIVENIVFEHHRNHPRDRIRLAINESSSIHMQCVLRVLRQPGEHICLTGAAGSGRLQTAKLAAAACSATVFHLYPDHSSFNVFRNGWNDVFNRTALAISTSNQPVMLVVHTDYCYERIEPRWMEYVRLWLEKPEFDSMGDEQLIALGEQIIENEKSLVSHMQTQGIRLPGQRMVRFLPIEVLKEPEILRSVLEARVHDFLHVVFLVQPHLKTDFSWCTVVNFKELSETAQSNVCKKLLTEARIQHPVEILKDIFSVTVEYLNKVRSPSWSDKLTTEQNYMFGFFDEFQRLYSNEKRLLHRQTKCLSEALNCISKIKDLQLIGESIELAVLEKRILENEAKYSSQTRELKLKQNKLEDLLAKIKQRDKVVERLREEAKKIQGEIEEEIQKPQEEFVRNSTALAQFGPAHYKQFSLLPRPGLGCRFVAEVLRHLLTKEFKPKRNTMDTWLDSQKFLRSQGLGTKILSINPSKINISMLQIIRKYVEHREFKEAKIEAESALAGCLCKWIFSLVELACTSSLLQDKQEDLKEFQQEALETEGQISDWKRETEILQGQIIEIEKSIREIEISLRSDRKMNDYQSRGPAILEALAPFYKRWKHQQGDAEQKENRLFANCALQAAFRILLVKEDLSTKMCCLKIITDLLLNHNEKASYSTASYLMSQIIRNIHSERHFCLLIDENGVLLNFLEKLFPHSTLVDMKNQTWNSEVTAGSFVRHLYSGSTTIFHNIELCPPVEYFEILCKWEEREVSFSGRLLELPDDCRLIFVAEKLLPMEPQLRRIMDVIVVNEQLDVLEPLVAEHTNTLFELLSEATAAEILESHEQTRRVIIEAEDAIRVISMVE